MQFWSEIILVISNRTRAARSFDFEITRMISDQIALHSVQLPLYIKIRIYTSIIKIRMYISRFEYIHQDSYIYIKIRIYTSRFVYIHQGSYIYIKIRIYKSRFVQFGHKGKHDRWIDYRVFKRRSKKAANEEAIFSLLRRVKRAMTEEMTPASNVEEELLRVFPFFPCWCTAASFVQSTSELWKQRL